MIDNLDVIVSGLRHFRKPSADMVWPDLDNPEFPSRLGYAAPEMLSRAGNSERINFEKVDMFSLGVIMYELRMHRYLFVPEEGQTLLRMNQTSDVYSALNYQPKM